jgi:protein-tyrosine kinase
METIRQAVERARARQNSSKSDDLVLAPRQGVSSVVFHTSSDGTAPLSPLEPHVQETELNSKLLQSKRIVCYDGKDQRSRPYDMLRTQVLQSMDANGWKVL